MSIIHLPVKEQDRRGVAGGSLTVPPSLPGLAGDVVLPGDPRL